MGGWGGTIREEVLREEEVSDAGHKPKNGKPLEDRKDKETDSPPGPPKENSPRHLDFSPLTPTLDSDLHHIRK